MSSSTRSTLSSLRRLAAATAVALLAAAPLGAQPVTFEGLATTDPVRYVPNCTMSGGLTFTAVGLGCGVTDAFFVYGPSEAAFYTGSAALTNNLTPSVDITAGGSAFSLSSVSLTSGLGLLSFEPTTVMFTGMLAGGGSVMQTVTVAAGTNVPMTYALTGFGNVNSVRYTLTTADYAGVQIDNLAFSAVAVVPEPGTVLLLGSGLAGLAVFARRRRRQ